MKNITYQSNKQKTMTYQHQIQTKHQYQLQNMIVMMKIQTTVFKNKIKHSTQIEYRYKILMDQLVYHKQPYIHISTKPLLMMQHISNKVN